MEKHIKYYGLDIETHDPLLKVKGDSWIWGQGEILITALYDFQQDKVKLFETKDLKKFLPIFKDNNNVIIGARISYDILWLCYALNIKVTDIKAKLIDIQITEALINPFTEFNLNALAVKYLNQKKGDDEIKEIAKSLKLSGDARGHLKFLIEKGYKDVIYKYVSQDAKQAVLIHFKQMLEIEKLNCLEAFEVYQKANFVSMFMKQKGVRIDYEKWKLNAEKIGEIVDYLEQEFYKNYGEVNLNAPAQVGELFSKHGCPVNFKITVRGFTPVGGVKFNLKKHGFTPEQRKTAYERLSAITSSFVLEKEKLFIVVDSSSVASVLKSLTALGYSSIATPIVNKHHLKSVDEKIVQDYLLLKQVLEIQKKFLGEKFERYFSFTTGECRLHTSFETVGGRATGRFSSVNPNLQNVPARVVLWEGTDKEINIAAMCREVFIPEEGHKFIRMDFNGQENRWMAYFGIGEDGEFIRAKYRQDPMFDEHDFVVKASGLDQEHEPKIARKYAKTIRFAVAYGASVKRIAIDNNWEYDKAKDLVNKILNSSMWFSKTKEYLINSLTSGKAKGIRTVLKRFIVCPEKDKAYRYYNYLIQGSAADQMKAAMVKIFDFIQENNLYKDIILLSTIHDELCLSVSPRALDKVSVLKELMENAIPVDVPFICSPEIGINWAYTEEMKERVFEEKDLEEEDYV